MLENEKVKQAKELLKEFDIDCWVIFVRESQINRDPTLAFFITNDIVILAISIPNALLGENSLVNKISPYFICST